MCTQREVVALQLVSFCVHNLDYRVLVLVLGIYNDSVYVVGEFVKQLRLECFSFNQLVVCDLTVNISECESVVCIPFADLVSLLYEFVILLVKN